MERKINKDSETVTTPDTHNANLVTFKDLNLPDSTVAILQKRGFIHPTPIQRKIIPLILMEEVNLVGLAQTGTGKTAAFGIPLLEELQSKTYGVQALVLVPTRELALQVTNEINSLKGDRKLRVVSIYGGQSMGPQLAQLKKGVDIVVGTPGRILDHLNRGTLSLKKISFFVLDEADEMLKMGFIEEVEEILTFTPEEKRMLLFSATMPDRILGLVENTMGEYKMVKMAKENSMPLLVDQIYYRVALKDKISALGRIIDASEDFYGFVFCRTKAEVDDVALMLQERGFQAEAIHGDISQSQREKVLGKFRDKRLSILVATDVAARGIDVPALSHVINFSLPQNPESYVHRIGRTGRSGKEGKAITLVTPDEKRKILFLQRILKANIREEKLPQVAELLRFKKERLGRLLQKTLETYPGNHYQQLAEELLKDRDSKAVVASLIHSIYRDELNQASYKEMAVIPASHPRDEAFGKSRGFEGQKSKMSKRDLKNFARLFVAKGKQNGMTQKKLMEFLKDHSQLAARDIVDIQIYDKYSFISLPHPEAHKILKSHKKKISGGRPMIELAKP